MNRIEFVEADLLDSESLDRAIEGCDYVIHVASPFVIGKVKNEDDLLGPAVKGTRAILEACWKHWVRRLVVTSSTASVVDPTLDDGVFNEKDWAPINKKTSSYSKSKILAEKECWEYLESLPEQERFELITMQPCFIIGPTLTRAPFSFAS